MMRCFVRALFAPRVLVLTLSAGLLVPTAASASNGHSTERAGSRWTGVWDDQGTRAPRVRLAKAVYSDSDAYDDDDEARPRRRTRTEDSERRPRYAQRRHKRVAKHHHHVAANAAIRRRLNRVASNT